ncbi:transcriptional regulator [Aquimarina atlantica]|uniref:Transcriptional regulator n=1 Tax=Aquimarina atlantica TaxID=1317122 RepID=A0A023BTT1_9FLAO|nr:LytTR family DNA-binding domain-containing protein [Aquimarina atlantica]EZH73390.1 transcriptional regulator [Aquimarina atlantica]
MGKDKLYFLTFISIALIFLVMASLGINYSIKICVNLLVDLQLESSKREVKEIARLSYLQIKNGESEVDIIDHIQEALYETEPGTTFIVAINKNDEILSHPKPELIHKKIIASRRLKHSISQSSSINEIYDILMDYEKKFDGVYQPNNSEILYEIPIKQTNISIVSVVNLNKLLIHITKLKRRLYTIFILMGILIIIISFFAVRFIGSFYEKELEVKNSDLEKDIINLTKLNLGVFNYQQRVFDEERKNEASFLKTSPDLKQANKKRLLTFKRNELIPTNTKDITYINTENSITYVVNTDGKRSTSNLSLDEIYNDLDNTLFFRANRQFIVRITAIKKIIKYGNSQLKILIHFSEIEILISKNKAAEFKKWLNA